GSRASHSPHQARARTGDDMGRARHADGGRSRRPPVRAQLRRAPGRRTARRGAQGSPCRRGLSGAPGRRRGAGRIIRGTRRTTMELFIGTSDGLLIAGDSGAPAAAAELKGRTIRALLAANGHLFAGADDGVYRSTDGGRSWRLSGVQGQIVWELAVDPQRAHKIHAGTQPAALYRSGDGGDSWLKIESLTQVPGAERWCVPNSPAGARARALAIDAADPNRWWVGVEVGGVLTSRDAGASWTCVAPGNDPDVHVLVADPGRPATLYPTTGLGRFQDDPEPMGQRIAGLFGSDDGGDTWRYLWAGVQPRYPRPRCTGP